MPVALKEGQWSLCWDCCQECGTTDRRHKGNGLCTPCYDRKRHEEHKKYCLDCGATISMLASRCLVCANKHKWRSGVYDGAFDEECSRKHSEAMRAAWQRGDFEGVFTSEAYRQKRSEIQKAARARGDYDSEETRRKMSEASRAAWARGAYEGRSEKLSEAIKAAWARGDYDNDVFRQKNAETTRAAWDRGAFDNAFDDEMRHKVSEAKRVHWASGVYEGVFCTDEHRQVCADIMRQRWERGDFDNVFQSPTSIEMQVAAALDILGIEHEPQYRPDGYSRIFDEFLPPNTLIEVQGDYWHGDKRPEQQQRDAEKAQWAAEHGYKLITLWEHEINAVGAWALVMERVGGSQ